MSRLRTDAIALACIVAGGAAGTAITRAALERGEHHGERIARAAMVESRSSTRYAACADEREPSPGVIVRLEDHDSGRHGHQASSVSVSRGCVTVEAASIDGARARFERERERMERHRERMERERERLERELDREVGSRLAIVGGELARELARLERLTAERAARERALSDLEARHGAMLERLERAREEGDRSIEVRRFEEMTGATGERIEHLRAELEEELEAVEELKRDVTTRLNEEMRSRGGGH